MNGLQQTDSINPKVFMQSLQTKKLVFALEKQGVLHIRASDRDINHKLIIKIVYVDC